MPKKKENILGKIVQKDYNNVLEKVIETKDFDEEVKNLLLSILYKIDVSYKDYKKVKRNIEPKQQYTEKIINTIDSNCNTIKIAKPNSKQAEELGERTFLVDTKNKKIICFPVERKLLYSISKIGKQDKIVKNKYFVIDKTISNLINIGNNINTVEPLRDFNGWSWMTIRKEIENISYNLIYQNLSILVGEEFLNSWIANKEYLIDYYDEFQNELSEKFGIELKKKIITILETLSILLEIEIDPSFKKILKELNRENEEKLLQFQDNQAFVENLTESKKEINRQLKKLEKILSNKETLSKEYKKKAKNNEDNKEIFNIKILEQELKAEKQKLLEQLEEKNELLNPKKFVAEKIKLEKRKDLLKIAEIKDKKREKIKMLKELQKTFLEAFLVLVNKAETKEEIVNLMYILRYYSFVPFDEKTDIDERKELKKDIFEVKEQLLKKAIDFKILSAISEDEIDNIEILQFIFKTRIMSMEDIYISIKKENEFYCVEFSEKNENSYEEKFMISNIKKEMLNIKLNKKFKIFI